jgi:hypothetical protein
VRTSENVALTNRAGLVFTNGTVTMSAAQLDTLLDWAREEVVAEAQALPVGWKLVPVEPTPRMLAAGSDTLELNPPFGGFISGTHARIAVYQAMLSASPPEPVSGWRDIATAPRDRSIFLGAVDGVVRLVSWGKTSHVPIYGFCLADQGAEDYDLCEPSCWQPLPSPPSEPGVK